MQILSRLIVFSTLSFMILSCFAKETSLHKTDPYCNVLNAYFDCARSIEHSLITGQMKELVRRDGESLNINTDTTNVALKDFREYGDGSYFYTYLAYFQESKLHALYKHMFDGGMSIIVSQKSGKITEIGDFPELAPNGERFVSITRGVNRVQIWRIENGDIALEHEYQSDKNLTNAKWFDAVTLQLDEKCESLAFDKKCQSVLRQKSGQWQLKAEKKKEIPLQKIDSRCTANNDSFECAQLREHQLIHGRMKKILRRDGKRLDIKTDKKTVTLTDNDDEEFIYLAYFQKPKLHILRGIFFSEVSNYLFISQKSGKTTYITAGFPNFAPNGKRFVSMSSGGVSGYEPDRVQIWRIENGAIVLEREFATKHQAWNATDAKWLDAQTLQLDGICKPFTAREKYCHSVLTLQNGRWKLKDSGNPLFQGKN